VAVAEPLALPSAQPIAVPASWRGATRRALPPPPTVSVRVVLRRREMVVRRHPLVVMLRATSLLPLPLFKGVGRDCVSVGAAFGANQLAR
jgi:hypothetical protein